MNSIEVKGKKYSVLKLLGHGKGGYSYLVTDGNLNYVCKQIHHEPCPIIPLEISLSLR